MNTHRATRIIPGLKSEYAIVSLPANEWYWIDQLVESAYRNGYEGFMRETRKHLTHEEDLEMFLATVAWDMQEKSMRREHNLSNDNDVMKMYERETWLKQSPNYPKSFTFPTIFQVFKFLPHATDMETLWQRRNYRKYRPRGDQ